MSANPFHVCPRDDCGFPTSGCRFPGCNNKTCRENQLCQGVELTHKKTNEFEYLDKFDSEEPRWRSSTRYIDPSHGFEPPFRPHRHHLTSADTVDCTVSPSREQKPWRPIHRYIPIGTGALSESWRPCHKHIVPQVEGYSEEWKPSIRCNNAAVANATPEFKWKSHIRCYHRLASSETVQSEFHPSQRYIPQSETEETLWRPHRGPGANRHHDQWVPPFRAATMHMESDGCISWQCPRRAPGSLRPLDEWHPPFRCRTAPCCIPVGCHASVRQHHHQRDQWFPPWQECKECAHRWAQRSPSVASVEDEEYKDESKDEPAELVQVECSKETLESKQNGD